MIRAVSIALSMAAVALAACGDDDGGSPPAMRADVGTTKQSAGNEGAAASAKSRGRVVTVVDSQFGRVIADGKGEAFYLFDKERTARAECYGACAAAWPPVLTRGEPRAGTGVGASKLGTTRRRDGRLQVTYAGHPLYYYVDDSPGTILCQKVDEFGGLWLVVKPNGRPVR